MSNLYILSRTVSSGIGEGQFGIGKAKLILDPLLPGREEDIAPALEQWMTNRVILTIK